eukprot:CAMPEP_0184688224 /NCGR_PEP_ID=MMETSP0312-20130426/29013_1 /TAXON_ID=31354 /ORGANISM="Compsopogon coeruleus, Strain SAG 36.94" /LENGTH=210 /DNA_ID=CAMNT_0027145119 /DNA_START=136 /DNA_END=765 /DNA_ORIENTATION=+
MNVNEEPDSPGFVGEIIPLLGWSHLEDPLSAMASIGNDTNADCEHQRSVGRGISTWSERIVSGNTGRSSGAEPPSGPTRTAAPSDPIMEAHQADCEELNLVVNELHRLLQNSSTPHERGRWRRTSAPFEVQPTVCEDTWDLRLEARNGKPDTHDDGRRSATEKHNPFNHVSFQYHRNGTRASGTLEVVDTAGTDMQNTRIAAGPALANEW